MKAICLAVVTIFAQILLVPTTHAIFPQFHTTFRLFGSSDVQPTSREAANHQGWHLLHGGCDDVSTDSRFAGNRLLQPTVEIDGKLQSNMIQIYDSDGQIAGMQSLVPVENFLWDCTQNEFYVKEFIKVTDSGEKREFCVSTMYFRDPTTICTKGDHTENTLFIQKGNSSTNLVRLPRTRKEAEQNQDFWAIDNYWLGMGHHITPNLHGSEDCKSFMPLQVLYAKVNGDCINTGFVWSHWGSNATDQTGHHGVRPHGDQWEHANSWVVKAILSKPAQCEIDGGSSGTLRTMHVFLGGSTSYCF